MIASMNIWQNPFFLSFAFPPFDLDADGTVWDKIRLLAAESAVLISLGD